MYTYNTAANVPTEMWLEDGANFWDYKVKVNVDYNNRTFTTNDFIDNTSYDCKVKITDGKYSKEQPLLLVECLPTVLCT